MRSAAPLVVELGRSRSFALAVVAVLAAALLAVLLAAAPAAIKLVLAVAALAIAANALKRAQRLAGLRLILNRDGAARWRLPSDRDERVGRIASSNRLSAMVAITLIDDDREIDRVLIVRDMVDADTWRRLNARLIETRGASGDPSSG